MSARAWMLLTLAACGPNVGNASESVGTGETSSSAPTTTTATTTATASTTSEPDPTTSSDGSGDSSSSSADTTTGETCVPGTFVGLVSTSFESDTFESCETGDTWWFVSGGNEACPPGLWVRVEGELCGPGNYGHIGSAEYELRGDVVEGPCEADCEGEPEPATCDSFQAFCPYFECDAIAQDCPTGQRCVPTVLENGPPWNGTTCVPAPDPAQMIGETCTSDAPWQDDCEPGGVCAADDRGVGTCAAICHPNLVGACGDETCWPCDFAEPSAQIGVCGATEVAC